MPNDIQAWVTFLTGLIDALENGQIAADSLKGKTFEEMVEISGDGWDKAQEAIDRAKNTP